MRFTIANTGLMCSTLILGDFWETYDEQDFVRGLFRAIKNAEDENTKRFEYCAWGEGHKNETQVLDGYPVENYAFVTGTLLHCSADDWDESSQDDVRKVMKKFGFKFSDEAYNSKNDTFVVHFIMSVSDMLEKLKMYNENGTKKEIAA